MRTRRSFLSSLVLLAAVGGAALLWRRQLTHAPLSFVGEAASSGPLPFAAPRSPMPVIHVGLGDRIVPAMVDSGAQYSVIDAAFAQELGLPATWTPPVIAYGVGGGPQIGRGVSFDLKVGALHLQPFRAVTLTLGPLSAGAGVSIPLVLGQDLLRELVCDIDFPSRRLSFHRPEYFTLPPLAEPVEAKTVGRALHATVTLEGHPIEVLVDTGSTATLSLSRETAQATGLLDGRRVRPGRAVVLGGVIRADVVEVKSVAFSEAELQNVEVQIFDVPPAVPFPDGLLGVLALRPFRAILDLGRGKMHLVA